MRSAGQTLCLSVYVCFILPNPLCVSIMLFTVMRQHGDRTVTCRLCANLAIYPVQ